jgi:hypothetical protein
MDWCVLTLISRGGQDNRHVKGLAKSSMGHSLVVVKSRIPVTGQLVETFLDINNEEDLAILVSPTRGFH